MRRTLANDVTLSRYRIEDLLGAGGMGEVYKAWDSTLERNVALKVLPPALVQNADRLRRFIQEAKSASSLNHPNIVTIHDAGVEGDLHFITMELIDGETLREKISAGASLRSLIGWLAQAADGLAKAHAAGIVHRDLKPDNIMITRDGYAKVLDFGLAKLIERTASSNAANEVTQVRADDATREGFVVGTIGYMSPEQILGQPVDHRSDLFSFGAILYEATTRRRAFSAESDVDLMHKIVHEQPEPVDRLNPATPAELRKLIRRCLAKDPDQRVQSMKDLAIELHEIHDEFDSLKTQSDSHSMPTVVVPTLTRRRKPWSAIVAGLVVVLLIGGGIALWRMREPRIAAPKFTLDKLQIRKLTTAGNVRRAAISPDGKYLAYVLDEDGRFSLRLRQVATGSDLQTVTPHQEDFQSLAFSPDSNYVFFAAREMAASEYYVLQSMPALGGPVQKLAFDADTAPAFSPDGKQIVFMRGVPNRQAADLIVANADGSNARVLVETVGDDRLDFYSPAWSPDGKVIAAGTGWASDTKKILVIDIATKQKRFLGDQWVGVESIAWMPDGSGLVVAAAPKESAAHDQIWFVSYPGGQRSRIYSDLNDYSCVMPAADGKSLMAVQLNRKSSIFASRIDGSESKLLTGPDDMIDWLSVAGDRVVYDAIGQSGPAMWIVDASGGRTQLTRIASSYPTVGRDGKTALFTSPVNGVSHVFAIDLDGNNQRQLTNGKGEWYPALMPDGQSFLYSSADGKLMQQPLHGGAAHVFVALSSLGPPRISPDGKSLVSMTWRKESTGKTAIFLTEFAMDGKELRSIPWLAERLWDWSPTGEIAYIDWNRRKALWSVSLAGGEPHKLLELPTQQLYAFGFSADGKTLYTSRTDRSEDVVLLTDFR